MALLALAACGSDEEVNAAGGATTATTNSGAGGLGGAGAPSYGGGGAGAAGGQGAAGVAGGGGGGSSTVGGGGAGSVGGGGGSAVGGGGAGATAECTWGDGCGPGLYCDAVACGDGKCVPLPSPAPENKKYDPACGCDGVTYWNATVAAVHGVAVASAGACPGGTLIECSSAMPCPGGASCKKLVADAATCGADSGECWQIPLACDLAGLQARACTTHSCELQCSLIQSNNAWYDDGTCP